MDLKILPFVCYSIQNGMHTTIFSYYLEEKFISQNFEPVKDFELQSIKDYLIEKQYKGSFPPGELVLISVIKIYCTA